MPYNIQQAVGPAPLLVNERFWGDASNINFGAMTSCIALVELTPNDAFSVRGVHLSLVAPDGTPVFDPNSNVAGQVSAIMQPQGNLRACLGRIGVWQSNELAEVQDFFAGLMQSLEIETWVSLPDGNLSVRVHNGTIQYAQGGAGWVNVPYL